MRDFKPSVWYNETGDQLEVLWSDEAYFAQWKNEYLTLLRSVDDEKKIIGIEITNFRRAFLFAGLRFDREYDEAPLTSEEKEEVEKKLQEVFGKME